ncbi:MAG: M13 family metallopeptidase [Sphingobacteriaceae bacterium]
MKINFVQNIKNLGYALLCGVVLSACNQTPNPGPDQDVVYKNLDTTASPGKDFFSYANGGWIKKNPIPAAYSAWGIGNLVTEEIRNQLKKINEDALKENAAKGSNSQKIGDFYASGMDSAKIEQQGLSTIQPELKQIEQIKDVAGLLEVIAAFQKIGVNALINPGVYQDAKNSEKMALHLWQGGIGLPNRDYYFNTDQKTANIRKDYAEVHLPTMLQLSGLNEADAKAAAKSVYDIEQALAAKSRKLEDLRDPYANYNKMSVNQLDALTSSIKWSPLFGKMNIKKVDSVIVGQPEFYKEVNTLLKSRPINDWKAYLRWNLVSSFASYLNKDIDAENFRFYGTVISGKKEQLPRWKRVLDTENSLMGEVLGQLFVKEYFPEKSKQRYTKLVEAIRETYRDRIKQLDWMSAATKAKALDKLNKITPKVGYPDKWKDFSSLEINRNSYVGNVMQANQFWYNYQINKLGKPVDRTEWDMTPQTYNAYYNPSNNEIVLPAAIFTIPGMRDEEVDDAVVYGYAGASTIGHEITHGFDDEGRQYDAAGNLKSWWTKEDEAKFKQRADGMVKQFNNFVVLDSMHVNGKATLGENIADLGGIVLGFEAFKKTEQYKKGKKINGLTPQKRYFLGYALGWLGSQRNERLANQILTDVHAPANLRVNGPFANVPEFYEAFGIKKGEPMWRPENVRVKIW